jgi:hypothetical protein
VAEREAKPAWSAVPAPVKARAERILGSAVTRAVRSYGGYGPSATFVLTLADGRRAFFKGTYPLPEGSPVKWMLEEELRVYANLSDVIAPWAPEFYGSFRSEGWLVVLIEAISGERVPPWSDGQTQRAATSYAEFHASTIGRRLPEWLPRDAHHDVAGLWPALIAAPDGLASAARLAGEQRDVALPWLRANAPRLADAERPLLAGQRRTALLHLDTRSDNIRLQGDLLRIFDWPFACIGPPELDLVAFAQSIETEGGPAGERTIAWYEQVSTVDRGMLAAAAAGIAGYFTDRSPKPDLPGLPRLRAAQRRQLRASLALVARLLDLESPTWLESVAG